MLITKAMSWQRVAKSFQALSAHCLLLSFTLLLVFKLDGAVPYSWWSVLLYSIRLIKSQLSHTYTDTNLFLGSSSSRFGYFMQLLPEGDSLYLLHQFPMIVMTLKAKVRAPSFKSAWCSVSMYGGLGIENERMCKALLPGDDESMSDEAIWETLPHFWVAISMVFFIAATVFTLLKLCGDVGALGWWDLFINYGIAECFAFLVCTKWSNPVIHRNSCSQVASSSSTAIRYLDWNSGLVVSSEDQPEDRMCGLQDIGGHIMKIPIIGFQVLLCMHLEGTPAGAKRIPIPVLFSPLFLLQGAGILFAASRYNTFCGYPPEIVKKMPKKDLAEEVWRLQAALGEQTEITKFSQQEYDRLQNEKVLCRVCFEREISTVLLPCRHRILCSTCCDKCKKCPICRVRIEERLPVYDV
ncbi:hypothetical protein RJ640_019504 [Escallonia rubra]|uniref:RING-type domain-containing protein n=1 Tax=Escallonia rubra TaxID=112253 RepID=A0AA88QV93_9ASTE|nr:hypothetical protein RJ640_019504 [Escallonia rubra]